MVRKEVVEAMGKLAPKWNQGEALDCPICGGKEYIAAPKVKEGEPFPEACGHLLLHPLDPEVQEKGFVATFLSRVMHLRCVSEEENLSIAIKALYAIIRLADRSGKDISALENDLRKILDTHLIRRDGCYFADRERRDRACREIARYFQENKEQFPSHFTVQDYLRLPEGEWFELINGRVMVAPSPTPYHQRAVLNLARLLEDVVKGRGRVFLAPLDVILSEGETVQPDILLVFNERAHIITERNIQGAPDLIVEVLSPSTAEKDRASKGQTYARAGVREYWLVDPEAQRIEVLRLGEKRYEEAGSFGPGEAVSSPLLGETGILPEQVFAQAHAQPRTTPEGGWRGTPAGGKKG